MQIIEGFFLKKTVIKPFDALAERKQSPGWSRVEKRKPRGYKVENKGRSRESTATLQRSCRI